MTAALQYPLWGTDGDADFPPKTALDRFFAKVEIGDCWLWLGATDRGYGKFYPHGKTVRAHRWLYEQLVGPVPLGMDLDHLCRVRACVNPDHLEVVTRRVNLARSPLTWQGRAASRGGGAVCWDGEASRPAPPPGPVADQTPTPLHLRDSRSGRPPTSRTPRAS